MDDVEVEFTDRTVGILSQLNLRHAVFRKGDMEGFGQTLIQFPEIIPVYIDVALQMQIDMNRNAVEVFVQRNNLTIFRGIVRSTAGNRLNDIPIAIKCIV